MTELITPEKLAEKNRLVALNESLSKELHKYDKIRADVEKQLVNTHERVIKMTLEGLRDENRDSGSQQRAFDYAQLRDFEDRYAQPLSELKSINVPHNKTIETDAQRIFFKLFNNMRSTTIETDVILPTRYDNSAKMKLCYGKRGFAIKRNIVAHALCELNSAEKQHYFAQIMARSKEITEHLRKNRMVQWASKLENFALIRGTTEQKDSDETIVVDLIEPIKHVEFGKVARCHELVRVAFTPGERGIRFIGVPLVRGDGYDPDDREFNTVGLSFKNFEPQAARVFKDLKEKLLAEKARREIVVDTLKSAFASELLAIDL